MLRVATYNVHRCIGRDGRKDPDRLAGIIRKLDAHIIGLQEVESVHSGRAADDQFTYLAQATGYTAIPGPTLFRDDGHYGNVLLTRHRVVEIRRHDLSVVRFEPRGALDVDVLVDGLSLRVIVLHLGLRAAERAEQLRMLFHELALAPRQPLVLLGDLNEWWPWNGRMRDIQRSFGRGRWLPTFPARFPVFALDRILARPPSLLIKTHAHRTPGTGVASDHLPLIAELDLRAAQHRPD